MAPQNKVEVLLVAKDNITATIHSMRGNISSGIGDAIGTIATLTAAIAASAIAFSSLGAGFAKATVMQTSQITGAYTLATLIGSTVTDAKVAVKDLNKEMIKLGDTLPGVTEDYQKFANTLTPTLAGMVKGDMSKFKALTIEASKYGGLLTATANGNGDQNAMTLNRYLGGTLSQSLARRQELFARNPTYFTFEKQAIKKLGFAGKDWEKQMTVAQRTAVFNLAGSMMFTPTMLAAYGNTADTVYQSLKSRLFNPVTGVFGFMREIKGLDDRTTLDAVTTFMVQLDIMGTQAGKWLSAHGINLDPMEAIGHMMDTASGWASAFTAAMKGDKSGINTMVADIAKGFKSIKIKDIVGALNVAMSLVSGAIASIDWRNFGSDLATGVATALKAFDWGGAEKLVNTALDAFVKTITGFVDRLAAQPLNRALGKATGGFLGTTKDGKPNGYSKIMKQSGDDFNSSIGGKVYNKFIKPFMGTINTDPDAKIDLPKPSKVDQPLSSLPSLGQMSNNGSGVFSPVINITGGMADGMTQTADYVLEAINNKYLQYRQEALV